MGLDMYLYAERYLGRWAGAEAAIAAAGLSDYDSGNHVQVRIEVGYWRKANQIHKWFVDNVQDGKDDCGTYYVGIEKLAELRETCIKVRDSGWKARLHAEPGAETPAVNQKLAAELLPTQEGFFFGSYEYDDDYLAEINETIEICDRVINMIEDVKGLDLYYHSSW